MTDDRWDHLADAFSQVVEAPPALRPEVLARVCGSDGALRADVEALVSASAHEKFLKLSVHDAGHDGRDAVGPGDRAGAYELVRPIGRGGMGEVWLARRADAAYSDDVAIKVIRRGLDTEDVLERFRRERQTLARLRHPNIASLLDGGALPDGRPYLVMEFVDGAPIDDFCEEHGLDRAERIALFLEVCGAVQHAHRNLIIHRDLKPANVLVSVGDQGAPRPTLVDFGVSAVLEGDEAAASSRTARTERRLTPSYASPEQLRGDPVTTASDVYSIGVVLYELLVGRSPYDADPTSTRAIERAVCEEPPRRPPGLPDDLARIVLKALHKDPVRRYATIEALAEDLRRYRAGFPVTAQADTLRYRARTFVRRNRAAVGAGALFLLLLVGTAVTSTALSVQARRARTQAEAQTQVALTMSAYLTDLLGSIDPAVAQGRDVTVLREALDRTALRVNEELASSPLVAAQLNRTLGEAYVAIGLYDVAEEHLRRAVDVERHAGTDVRDEDRIRTLLKLGACLNHVDDGDGALRALDEARSIAGGLDASSPLHGKIEVQVGVTHLDRGDEARAEPALSRAIGLLRATDADPADLALALERLGRLHVDERRLDLARPLLTEARALLVGVYGDLHPRIATLALQLGWCERRAGNSEAALVHFEAALAIREAILDPNHDLVATALVGLGATLEDLHRYEEAERHYLRGIAIFEATLGHLHGETATAYNNLGGLYRRMERHADAIGALEAAAEIYAAVRGPDDFFVSFPRSHLALSFLGTGEPERALVACDEALRITRLHKPEESTDVQALRSVRGAALMRLGRRDAAGVELASSQAWLEAHNPPTASSVARARQWQSEFAAGSGD